MRAILLFLAMTACSSAFASTSEMQTLIALTEGNIYGGEVPVGYTSKKVEKLEAQGELKTFIYKTLAKKRKVWRTYVLTSGEYDHISLAERKKIAERPHAELKVPLLLEIEEVYAIYKDGRRIGYTFELVDHVQSAIYQDGAWFDIFIDSDFNVVETYERSA